MCFAVGLSTIYVNQWQLEELRAWGNATMMEKQGVIAPGITPDLDKDPLLKHAEAYEEEMALVEAGKRARDAAAELEQQDPVTRIAAAGASD